MLRACGAVVGEAARAARSLSVDYLARPAEGEVEIAVEVLRRGRSLTFLQARMRQGDRLVAVCCASFSRPREGTQSAVFCESRMPEAPPPEACPPVPPLLPIHENYEMRFAFGAVPFSGGEKALGGGWVRLQEPGAGVSAELLAAISDGWPPSVMSRMSDREGLGRGVPTIELSVYFIAPEACAPLRGDDWLLARFETPHVQEGFLVENGEIWSPGGILLARSRQIAVVV